jgi:hypothetical protein
VLIEPDATTGRCDAQLVQVRVGQPPGDDPREHALQSLRDALLAPGAVNPVSEYLRSLAEI